MNVLTENTHKGMANLAEWEKGMGEEIVIRGIYILISSRQHWRYHSFFSTLVSTPGAAAAAAAGRMQPGLLAAMQAGAESRCVHKGALS